MDIADDKRIKATEGQLSKIVQLVAENKRPVARNLVKEIAFMSKTLADLRDQVNTSGPVDLFQQGSQQFLRESPALKAYNTTVQRYSLLYKQLVDLMPKDTLEKADSALFEFLTQE